VWVNPPYSRGLQAQFIAKASAESAKGCTVVMLLPARTDTRAFHAHIWDGDRHAPREGVEVRLIKGRLKFGGCKDAAPFPSMVVVFRPVVRTMDLCALYGRWHEEGDLAAGITAEALAYELVSALRQTLAVLRTELEA